MICILNQETLKFNKLVRDILFFFFSIIKALKIELKVILRCVIFKLQVLNIWRGIYVDIIIFLVNKMIPLQEWKGSFSDFL